MLPYLSRYMGHASFDSTYYYIHTSPDFMDAYAKIGPDSQPLSRALMPGQNRPLLLNPRPRAHPGPPSRQQLTATLSSHDQHQAQTRGTDST